MSLRSMGVSLVLLALPALVAAQDPAKKPPLVIESMAGKDLFLFYCGSCHGADARGRGPVASALKSAPADLTRIAMRNGGVFPRDRITAFVSKGGTQVPAHGTPDMPVWGPIFTGLDPSEARTKVRIENLVAYVESLQER
jgi:mono/diheme cytochrome c family protein